VDARSDLFSTGVLAYELLGGQRPFTGESDSVVMRAILTVDPPSVSTLNPLVPEGAVSVIRSMLEKDASKRCASATQAVAALEETIEKLEVRRGRELLREYAQDPEKVVTAMRSLRLSRHLNQGIHFEKMGQVKIDDALEEFRRVLFLDPEHELAKEHVQRLERDRHRVGERPGQPARTSPRTESGDGLEASPVVPDDAAAPPAEPPRAFDPLERPSGKAGGASRARLPKAGTGKPGAPFPMWARAAAALVVIGAVAATAILWPRSVTIPPSPELEIPPAVVADTSAPVTTVDSSSMVSTTDTVASAAADTIESIVRARMAADSSKWWNAIVWADSAWRDPRYRVRGPDSLVNKDIRLESRELAAFARRRVGQAANAQRIYERLLRADPKFRPRARWSTPEDEVVYSAAYVAVFPPDTTPEQPRTSGYALVISNPPATVLLEGKSRGEGVACQMFEVPTGHREAVLTTPDGATRRFEITVVEKRVTLVQWDHAGDGGEIVVSSTPSGATVNIDGKPVGVTPLRLPGLPPRQFKVTLSSSGPEWTPTERRIRVRSGKSSAANFRQRE
jgi:hypothetical protein